MNSNPSPLRMPPPGSSAVIANALTPPGNDLARELIVDCINTLEDHFEGQPTVYVSGGIPVYYSEDAFKRRITPDVMVVRDVPRKKRGSFLRWVEGKMPDVILEIAPGSTWPSQVGPKASLYYTLGVQEYYVFDTSGQRFEGGPLFGMVREDLGFAPLPQDEHGKLQSAILGLDLFAEQPEKGEWRLRFFDPESMQVLKTRKEKMADERARREDAERRATTAEAELRKLREELLHIRATGKV